MNPTRHQSNRLGLHCPKVVMVGGEWLLLLLFAPASAFPIISSSSSFWVGKARVALVGVVAFFAVGVAALFVVGVVIVGWVVVWEVEHL